MSILQTPSLLNSPYLESLSSIGRDLVSAPVSWRLGMLYYYCMGRHARLIYRMPLLTLNQLCMWQQNGRPVRVSCFEESLELTFLRLGPAWYSRSLNGRALVVVDKFLPPTVRSVPSCSSSLPRLPLHEDCYQPAPMAISRVVSDRLQCFLMFFPRPKRLDVISKPRSRSAFRHAHMQSFSWPPSRWYHSLPTRLTNELNTAFHQQITRIFRKRLPWRRRKISVMIFCTVATKQLVSELRISTWYTTIRALSLAAVAVSFERRSP